ncbi:MAG TPA: FtsX-like permease family protein, partial [Gemmatimonadales bacterium]|nr:FtsX-like permease family protein [Gemmatimonadales bacterium]
EGYLVQVEQGLLIFKLLMGAMTGISLLVGGIGIMNVLLASVAERTREIGVRKAIGARDRDVLGQFLAESVAITGAGAAVGTVIGVGGAYGVTAIMRAQTDAQVYAGFSVSTLLVAAAAAVVTGVAFGVYPALRAARLTPIDAIRHE